MIELTRLNGHPLFVNCDLIKWAEAAPDTMLTLINGEKVVVHESCAEVVERIARQRIRLLAEAVALMPDPGALLRAAAMANAAGMPSSAVPAEATRPTGESADGPPTG